MTRMTTHGWWLAKAVGEVVSLPEVRLLGALVALQIAVGAAFYVAVEGWSWLDAIYFSVAAITTVGIGDYFPETNAGKVFTSFYLLTGVGTMLSFVTLFGTRLARWQRSAPPEKSALDLDE